MTENRKVLWIICDLGVDKTLNCRKKNIRICKRLFQYTEGIDCDDNRYFRTKVIDFE